MSSFRHGFRSRRRNFSQLLALEPRLLFDGAVLASTDTPVDKPQSQYGVHQPVPQGSSASLAAISAVQASLEAHHSLSPLDPVPLADELTRATPDSAALPPLRLATPRGTADQDIAKAPVAAALASTLADKATVSSATPLSRQLLVVDPGIAGWDTMAALVLNSTEVLLLDPSRDALTQIASTLEQGTHWQAIHILSHGSAGQLELLGQSLDTAALSRYANDLQRISSALDADGDLLLYGCEIGQGEKGAAFLAALAAATGADVAASMNGSGPARLGGDSALEIATGRIETTSLALSGLSTLLAAPTITDSVTVTRTTPEDTPRAISGITIADLDGDSQSVTLSTTQGTMTLAAGSGVTITGGTDGSATVTFTGTLAQVNAAINGMIFAPSADFYGTTTIGIQTSDGVNTANTTLNVAVQPVNDAPTVVGGTSPTVAEGGAVTFSPATTVGSGFSQAQLGLVDVDTSALQTIIKIAALPTQGTLKLGGLELAVGATLPVSQIQNLTYTHNGSQVLAPTTDTFGITIDDGAGGLVVNQPVSVTITPVNQPPTVSGSITVIEGETNVRLDNNSLLPALGTPRGAINTTDPEGAAISTYRITSLPTYGTLFYNGTPITSASAGAPFVVSDITRLTYSHNGSETTADSFNIRVTDDGGGTGTPASASGVIDLVIYPNNDDPVLTTNVTQTLGSSSLTITPAMLAVTDIDSPEAALTYTLTSVPNPTEGYFTLNGQLLSAGAIFTQADIAAGRLVYVNRLSPTLTPRTDSIRFTVKDSEERIYPTVRDGGIYNAGTNVLTVNTFSIIVPPITPTNGSATPVLVPVNQDPVADGMNSTDTDLFESGSQTLTDVMLHATSNAPPSQLVYRLASLPTSGWLTRNGTRLSAGQSFTQEDINLGRVRFIHGGREDFIDTFTYTISDGSKRSALQTFRLTITPQNDTPRATTTGQRVREGGSFAVDTGNIQLSDADNSVSDLVPETGYAINNALSFRITGNVTHGTLTLNGVAVIPGVTEVTAAQLAAGALVYTHNGSENFIESFKLVPLDDQGVTVGTATNQVSTGTEVIMPISIYPVNDPLSFFSKSQLVTGEAGPIQEGATAIIGGATNYATINSISGSGIPTPATGAHLVFSDSDNSSVQRQYRITDTPNHGQLRRNGTVLGVGSVFTQDDLDNNRITYKHNGTETYADSFSYVVSDGDWRANDTTTFPQQPPPSPVASTYNIEISPRNDVPVLSAPASLDAFASGAGTTPIGGITLTDLDLADGITTGETDFIRVEVQVLNSTNALVSSAQLSYTATDPTGGNAFLSGKGNNSLVVQGTKAQVDAILASLTIGFSADVDASDYTIRVTADDRLYDSAGNLTTGANGGPDPLNANGTTINAANNRVSRDIALRASNFNDLPTLTNGNTYRVNEDAQITLTGFTMGDADSFGEDMTVTVELYSDAAHTTLADASTEGRLILGAIAGLTSATGNNTNTITLTGSLVELRAALSAVKFAGAANYNGLGTGNGSLYLRTTLADFNHADGQKTATLDKTITIVPVNDQPTLTVPGNQTLSNGLSIAINSGFTVGDTVDINQGATDYVEVTVAATVSGSPYGTISLSAQGGATITNNGTATVVVRGTTADVQATLNQMTYTPTDPNANNTVLINTRVNDINNGAESVGVTGNNIRTGNFTINVSNENEPPVLTAPTAFTVNEDSTSSASTTVPSISFTDSDDFGAIEQVTLDLGSSPKGTITLGTITGLTFTTGDGTSDTKMVFRGTKAALNAALAKLRFTPNANINTVGDANRQPLTITVDDLGNTGQGATTSDTKIVQITINPINDAPTRTTSSKTLTAVLEDTTNPPGATVANLFASTFSDATDTQSGGSTANNLAGIAIVANAATAAQGLWQYNDGSGWTNLPAVSLSTAFLLKSTDEVRFLPSANWNGTPGILTVRLIDDSAGAVTTGQTPNLSGAAATGGTTAYSNASNAVTLRTTVTAVNDAPIASGTVSLPGINEDTSNPSGSLISSLITAANYSDVTDAIPSGSSATALGGIAIVGNTANATTEGVWQYSTNGGTSWTPVPVTGLSDSSARVLPATAQLRFVPVANYNGTPGSLSIRLADSARSLTTSVNISSQLGGTNTWSAAAIPITAVVNPVNDTPTITGAGSTQSYTENDPAVVLEPALNLADVDDTQIDRAVISISGGFVTGDRLNFTDQLGISGSFNTATGILTLTGTASFANYQTALQSISFDSASDNPGNGTRTISWTVRDTNSQTATNGQQTSLAATTTVNVIPVNDAPAGTDKTVTLTEDAVYTFTASDFGFSDIDGNSLLGVKITTLPTAIEGVLKVGGVAVTAEQTLTVAQLATLTFTPVANKNGAELGAFTFQVQDDGGIANGGIDLDPVVNTFKFDITAVTDLTAADDTATTDEDTPVNSTVASNDSTTSGGTLTYAKTTDPAHGTVVFNSDGTYTYTPAANYACALPYSARLPIHLHARGQLKRHGQFHLHGDGCGQRREPDADRGHHGQAGHGSDSGG